MNFLRCYIYYILLHLTLVGSSLIQVGDALSVNLDSSVSYRHSSNILKSQTSELSDVTYLYTPGAVMNFGKAGTALDLKLSTYYNILKYKDYSDLDINLLKVYLNGSYNPHPKVSNNFSFSHIEGESAKSELSLDDAPALVETTTKQASFLTNYRYSPKVSFSLGVRQSEFSYDTYSDQLSSRKSVNIPLDLIYHMSNKLSVFYGISLTKTEVSDRIALFQGGKFLMPSYDTDSTYFNLGLKGSIMPKLTGQFSVGYHTLSFSTNTNDFNAFGAISALTWTFSPKLRTTLNYTRDFDAAGNGSTYRSSRALLSTVYSLDYDMKLALNIGNTDKYFKSNTARKGEETGRSEKLDNVSLDLHYNPSENYSFIMGYNLIRSDALRDYDLNVFKLTAKIKY